MLNKMKERKKIHAGYSRFATLYLILQAYTIVVPFLIKIFFFLLKLQNSLLPPAITIFQKESRHVKHSDGKFFPLKSQCQFLKRKRNCWIIHQCGKDKFPLKLFFRGMIHICNIILNIEPPAQCWSTVT